MPWAAVAGGVASAVASSALSSGSPGGGYSGGSYLPPNLGQAAGNEMGLIPQLGNYNVYGQNLGQAQGLAQQGVNSPYYGQALGGAQQAAGAGVGQGYQALGAADQLYGQMRQVPGLQSQLAQSAFDPQSQLYNYLQAQNMNQTNAQLAARGLNMSGVGAGIAAQQNQLFNQNWQNNLLQRQLMGAQGIGALNQSAGQLGTVGSALGTQGANLINQASAMPYQTQLNALQNQMGLLNTAGQFGQQASLPIQQQIADYNSYQGLGSPSSQFNQQAGAAQGQAALMQSLSPAISSAGQLGGAALFNWASGLNAPGNSDYYGTGSGYSPMVTLPSTSY